MQNAKGGMTDAIEHIGLDSGVMNHILENDFLSYLKRSGETPGTHEIACQTAVAT
jgi:hypothetical protein